MVQKNINVGTAINAGDGEAIRNAFIKINEMMTEVYGWLAVNGLDPNFIAPNSILNAKLATMPANSIKANLLGIAATPSNETLAAVKSALGLAPSVASLSSAYTVVAGDIGKVFIVSGTWVMALTAAATVGNGFSFYIKNTGTGIVTIDPNNTETIDGLVAVNIPPLCEGLVVCDGTNWQTIGLKSIVPLRTGSIANQLNLDIPLLNGYASYRLLLRNIEPVTGNTSLSGRVATDGVPNFLGTSIYTTAGLGTDQTVNPYGLGSGAGAASTMAFSYQQVVGSGYGSLFDMTITPGLAGRHATITCTGGYVNNSGKTIAQVPVNVIQVTNRITHLRFYYLTGNIANCDYELYGLRS